MHDVFAINVLSSNFTVDFTELVANAVQQVATCLPGFSWSLDIAQSSHLWVLMGLLAFTRHS